MMEPSTETGHYLNELWDLRSSRGDHASLMQYLEEFVSVYDELLQPDYYKDTVIVGASRCYTVKSDGSIHLEHLPQPLLQLIVNQLMTLQDKVDNLTIQDVRLASYLVQILIIVCRTNLQPFKILSSLFIGHLVIISSHVIAKLGDDAFTPEHRSQEEFLRNVLHLMERLYDPKFLWRKKIKGIETPASDNSNTPLIIAEVIPFFYESLQMHSNNLMSETQQHLLHMFGSILFGSHRNALLATSATTLEILIGILPQYMGLSEEQKSPQDDEKTKSESLEAVENDGDVESVCLVLQLLVKMVHVLHKSGPGQCQLDVKRILSEYFQLLAKASSKPAMQVIMISFIPEFLQTLDRPALQILLLQHGCFDHLKKVMQNFRTRMGNEGTNSGDEFAVQFVSIVNSLVAGSMSAKDKFSRCLGTDFMLDHLKAIASPSRELFRALVNMGVEDEGVLSVPRPIKNVFIILMLFDWLPDIKQEDKQIWLSSVLLRLFTSCTANKILAGHCKIITKVVACLINHPTLHEQTVLNLITLFERLGSFSVTPRQTLAFFELLRQDSTSHQHLNKYFDRMLTSLTVMSHKEMENKKPAYFFDLQDETSGITAPTIKKWGGNGFSLHTWVCLEYCPFIGAPRRRRQLYSFSTDSGTGMEAFFTGDCQLVVAVSTKKSYYTVKLNEFPFTDNKWHCVQIVHHPARKILGFNGLLTVHVDNTLRLSTSVRYPSLSSTFTLCHIGSSGHRTNASMTSVDGVTSNANENNSSNADRVVTIDNGTQDDVWGQATSLLGQLGSVVVFNEALKESQMTALHNIGLDMWKATRSGESPFEEIPSSKIVLYYEAKACYRHVCKDLSCNASRDGRLTGHKIYTWDIKDSINCIGGMAVITPIIDVIRARLLNKSPTVTDFSDDEENASNNEYHDLLRERKRSITACRYHKNPLANLFNVITSFLTSSNSSTGWHSTNADVMIKCASFATIGALLQKLPIQLLDKDLLRAIQHLVTCVNQDQSNGSTLLTDIYQYILFDFRIWCLTNVDAQFGHVQYLSTLIKENKKSLRSTFGVQYMLDVIKTYYCTSGPDLSDDDALIIRCSLLGLVKFYVIDDITSEEVDALLNFVSSANEENEKLICEILDLLKSLWMCRCRDQLCNLLVESKSVCCFYSVLGIQEFSNLVKADVCEVLALLYKTPRMPDRHKSLLRHTGVGLHGVFWQMREVHKYPPLCQIILDMLQQIDCDAAPFVAALHVMHRCDVMTKRKACQLFLTFAYSKASFIVDCTKQHAWQETFARLFIDGFVKKENQQRSFSECLERTESTTEALNPDVINRVQRETLETNGHDVFMSSSSSSLTDQISSPSASDRHSFKQQPSPNGSAVYDGDMDFTIVNHNEAKMDGDVTDLLTESIFLLVWRGITGSTNTAWTERRKTFAAIDDVAREHNVIIDPLRAKTRILESCVEAALSDVRESSGVGSKSKHSGVSYIVATENSERLMQMIFGFLRNSGEAPSPELWTATLMENVFALYDALVVWEQNDLLRGNEWTDLANIGINLLLGCIATRKLELVAMSSAKLHNLIHSRVPGSTQEVCYILDALHGFVNESIKDDSDVKEFVVPLVRDLLDKNFERLNMSPHLSELPPTTGSPRFYEDFLQYCVSHEWKSFIKNCVLQNAEQFRSKAFADLLSSMTSYAESASDELKVSHHKSARERGEMKLRFRAEFESDFYKRQEAESERQSKNLKSLHNQNVNVLRQWRAVKRFLASERGLWRDRNPGKTYWKLSNAENFSRMRLKLTENYNFDRHEDSSRLRDNLAPNDVKELTNQEALVPASAVLPASDASKEDDSVGDEDWSLLATNTGASNDEQTTKEKQVISVDCQLVTLMDVVAGKLEISTTHVYFYDRSTGAEDSSEPGMDFKWSLYQLREVHLRRYNLRKSALELFLIDQTNYFINFVEPSHRHTVYKAILSVRPPNLLYYGMRTPQELLKASGLTQKWVQREISNFDYLMQLNTIAGRTYNDLSQYPVFPWILKDYTSEKLDLEDPNIYRDLSKPIGILNPKNEREVGEKYDHFEDPSGVIKKFHYGSHYSNAASVLFYLLRMEPFTTLHIQLQAGRFDLADRQFHSLAATFQAMMETSNDVKELIPEFFYMPEFLVNSNGFDLGKLQFSKETVDNVILPAWCKSPEDFVYQHRKALESDHVSNNLHSWIDLIFGYKQRGEEAVKAFNVFYYCTYEGAVDLDAITDPIHRKAVEAMINNFGQTPTQLLREAHPRRMSSEEATRKVASGRIMSTLSVGDVKTPNVLDQPDQLKSFFVEIMNNNDPLVYVSVPRSQSHSFIQSGMPDAMVTVSEGSVIGLHGWLPYDRSITNYFTFEKDPAVDNAKLRKTVKGLLSPGLHLSPNLFLVTHDAKFLLVGGYWDNSIRVMTVRGKMVTCLVRHLDVVTCLALDHTGGYLISGSYDTTCIVWKISTQGGITGSLSAHLVHILYGHDDVVTCVVINTELDVALSSSKDGTCVIHTVHKGNYVRTIRPAVTNPKIYNVPSIALSEEGKIVLYARSKKDSGEEKHFLHLYSINGQHLALDCLESRLGHMTICGEHVVTGDIHGVLLIRELVNFNEISRLALQRPITCVFVTKGMSHIFACLRDGKLIIVGVDRPPKSRGLFTSQ
uniref:Neurobeachin-like protein 1 n=1 Tax=Phallusia mammillata TaxID=59560 RepID=A0A6F9DML5_9ASCI|nr:neurobeachin-like protein 1 [Phallusia mammillata]